MLNLSLSDLYICLMIINSKVGKQCKKTQKKQRSLGGKILFHGTVYGYPAMIDNLHHHAHSSSNETAKQQLHLDLC